MRLLPLLAALLSVATLSLADVPGPIDVQPDGRGRAIVDWPRERAFAFDTWVVRDNWASIAHAWDLRDRTYTPGADGSRTVSGHFDLTDKRRIAFDEQIGPARVDYTFTNSAQPVANFVGLYWVATLPLDTFRGGHVVVGGKRFELTDAPHDPPQMGDAMAEQVTIRSADDKTSIELRFDHPCVVRVQDARVYKEQSYQLIVPIAERPTLEANARETFAVAFKTRIEPAATPAAVAIDASKPLNRFDGIGGNFVYGIDGAVPRTILRAMPPPAWARIGMELREWSPKSADELPTNNDLDGSPLRQRFELDRELFKRSNGNVIATVWYPPEWLFAEPKPYRDAPGKIPRERWRSLSNSIVSYLLHLKAIYGVEPKLVSLNEPDWGVYVLQDGEEMRDWTKLLGDALQNANLRTKILLGDVADLHRGWDVIQPTLADPEACKYVGALAYHPWAGQQDAWKQWADVAQQRGWPLLATEMGADAEAWHDGSFDGPLYALREATRYVEQLRDGRTAAILEWEWTNDFAMAKRDGEGIMTLTPRGQFIRQIAATVPNGAHVVQSNCDASDATAAALVGNDGAVTLHVVRRESGKVHVTGLPSWASEAKLERVDLVNGSQPPTTVKVDNGACSIEAAAGELITLSVRR